MSFSPERVVFLLEAADMSISFIYNLISSGLKNFLAASGRDSSVSGINKSKYILNRGLIDATN